jgi:hypothetical protein
MSGQGKTAIVTGASQGIGAGIVKGFEQHPVRQHSRGCRLSRTPSSVICFGESHCAEYRGRYFRGVDIY